MFAHTLHQQSQSSEDFHLLMRLQPCLPIGEEPGGHRDLTFECRRIVAAELRDWRAIERLNNINHR
jgi:hypothetical protein